MTRTILAVAALSVMALASVQTGAQSPGATPSGPTYSRDVAPILYKTCTNCHRPGEIGPMSLLTYKDARPWAKSIAARVSAGTMPPWHADPATGEFLNDRRLSEAEKETILQWVAAEAPEGDPSHLPAPPKYAEGWTIGQPDVVLPMLEDYPIPASGTIAYQYFEVPTNFTEDKWIQAFEVRPSNRAVVHHVIVYTRPPAPAAAPPQPAGQPARRPVPLFSFAAGMDIPAGQTGGRELPPDQRKPRGPNDRPAPRMLGPSIGAYVPGTASRRVPSGHGRAPRGRLHGDLPDALHDDGEADDGSDEHRLDLREDAARDRAARHRPDQWQPPHSGRRRRPSRRRRDDDQSGCDVVGHAPAHARAREAVDLRGHVPDGRKETILSVPRYDFEWQTDYIFKQPLKLPKGTTLHATAWYDNSPTNKSNPDPRQDVWWGDQTWEEMMFTGLTYSVDPVTATGAQ